MARGLLIVKNGRATAHAVEIAGLEPDCSGSKLSEGAIGTPRLWR
jgi:hypothetical protein